MNNPSNRPTSPHLQVYRLPLTALISITHRATGVALSLAAVLLVWALSSVAVGGDYYAAMHTHLSAWYGQIVLFGFTFALFCLGAVREILGFGTLLGFPLFGPNFEPWAVMVLPPGGFLTLGALLAFFAWLEDRKEKKKAALAALGEGVA